jgi:hypothetical protein
MCGDCALADDVHSLSVTTGHWTTSDAAKDGSRASSLELTAILAIRTLYEPLHTPADIDAMLLMCNGMRRKFDDHLVKKSKGLPCEAEFKALRQMAIEVNTKRNNICHMGIFVGRNDARRLIGIAHDVIGTILHKRGEVFVILPVQ